MQRNKNVQYDADDLYDSADEEEYGGEVPEYTTEDKDNFATLTPVVRAELEETGLSASQTEIEEALWHYYWDVGKSVSYLKNSRTPRPQQQPSEGGGKKGQAKAKSKFDQAAEKSAEKAGPTPMPPTSAADWFRDIPWSNLSPEIQGHLVPTVPPRPYPKLLGGSSKLAKLAEERRRKAAAAASSNEAPSPDSNGSFNSLDRLNKPKDATKENDTPASQPEPKRYPIRKKREPTPPPREPTPPPPEPEEETPDIRASPTGFGRTLSTGPPHAALASSMTLQDMLGGAEEAVDAFTGPSPDDIVAKAQAHSKGEITAAPFSSKPKQNASSDAQLAKKTEQLQVAESTAPKVKSKGLDVPKLWAEGQADRKAQAAFVVIGHVDHGKSTLMGRLLLDTGGVSQRDIDRYQKQASELGKSSFALAWVMDTGSEERERGVTVDIAQHHFSTASTDFTILDAPGHRDFVPNMIAGASMADLALLVVDANQLASGLKGQTREHVLLAKAVGITRIVVAVNKLDLSAPEPWSQSVFADVQIQIKSFLSEAGFSEPNMAIIPCSGLNGTNVANSPPSSSPTSWIQPPIHLTLLQALEAFTPPPPALQTLTQPLRLQISDVFRGTLTAPLSISGRLRSGSCQIGDTLLLLPSNTQATIRAIEVAAEPREYAVAGQIAVLHLAVHGDLEAEGLRAGDVAVLAGSSLPSSASPSSVDDGASAPPTVVKSATARVKAVQALLPMGVEVFLGRWMVAGEITGLKCTLQQQQAGDVEETGELEARQVVVKKKKPRVIRQGEMALVELGLAEAGVVTKGDRVVLRNGGATVAVGFVEAVRA